MNAGKVFVAPEGARDAIEGEEDFLGFPFLGVEEGLEVAGGLVEVEDEGVIDGAHRIRR